MARRDGKRVSTSVSLPAELRDRLDERFPENRSAFIAKVVGAALDSGARADVAGLEAKQEVLKEREQQKLDERERIDRELEEIREEMEAVEEQIEELRGDADGELSDALDQLDHIHANTSSRSQAPGIGEGNPAVQKQAEKLGIPREELVGIWREERAEGSTASAVATDGGLS